MACVQTSQLTRTWRQVRVLLVIYFCVICKAEPQLDLPQISSTQQNPYGGGYGLLSSTPTSINAPGNQYDVSQNPNFQFSTQRPSTPGVYPVSSTPNFNNRNGGINPDINNNGYPNLDYGNGVLRTLDDGRNPGVLRPVDNSNLNPGVLRPIGDVNREDRIDINNDPNFRRNDPNFIRNDPNYVGTNPYDFNRGNPNFIGTNTIDDRVNQVNLQQIREFLHNADEQASKECTNNVAAQWNFETDVNDATQHAAVSFKNNKTYVIVINNYFLQVYY